jgi:predicted thioesterase
MPVSDLQPGDSRQDTVTVAPEHFASRIVPGTPDVFSTPALGALVERTAAMWLDEHLDPGQMTVGAQIVINHTAPTPQGMTVTATVIIESVEGRKVDFTWVATDGIDAVGNGTHRRFVVDVARFEQGLADKRSK